jgi:glycerol uptake facilitator-like aquaporin
MILEFVGTMCITFFTNWGNILYRTEKITLSSYSLIYGLSLSVLIYVGIQRSGAHFDPGVTLSMMVSGTTPILPSIIYIAL